MVYYYVKWHQLVNLENPKSIYIYIYKYNIIYLQLTILL